MAQAGAPRLELRLLGGFELRLEGRLLLDASWDRRKPKTILKLLALQPARSLHREALLELLWPGLDARSGANNLHQAIHVVRRASNDSRLIALHDDAVSLAPDVWVDVAAFRELAADPARADLDRCERAAALYRTGLLPEDPYEEWARTPREDLALLHRALLMRSAALHASAGGTAASERCLRRLIAIDPTDEEAAIELMRVLSSAGAHRRALAQYHALAASLADELDATPSADATALADEIRGRIHGAAGDVRAPEQAVHGDDFVGRTDELLRMRQAFTEAAAASPGLVLVSGEPGIGKTRLAEELAAHASAQGALILWGRCEPGASAPSYWPWMQILRGLDAPVAPRDDTAALLAPGPSATDQGVSAAMVDEAERERRRFQLHDAVASALRRASDQRPLVIVIDDLHDADGGTLRLLLHVVRQARDVRILVVGTFREARAEQSAAFREVVGDLVRERLKARLRLEGLTADEVRAFVEMRLGVTPTDADVAFLHRQTHGNAFFLRECMLMLEPQLRGGGLQTSPSVPPSVREASARRLAALTPACVEMLNTAAVAGARFSVDVLARASGLPAPELRRTLEEALDQSLIRRPEAGKDESYEFCHAIIQQTLYESIPFSERTALHGRVGEATVARGETESDLARLAHHFVAAARGGGDTARGIEYARRAGDADLRVFDWESARRHWEMARELLETSDDREQLADLLEELPSLIQNVGGDDLERSVEYLERAIAIREQLGQREKAAEGHSRLGIILSMHVGDPKYARITNLDRALNHYRAAEPILGGGPDRASVAMFHAGLATVAFSGVRVPEGLASSERGMEIADRLGLKPVWAACALLRAGALKLAGRLAESRALFRAAHALADAADDVRVAFYAITNLADWTEGYDAGDGPLLEAELQRPRNATASVQRDTLLTDIGSGQARNGRLAEARRMLALVPPGFLQSQMDYYDGAWERCLDSLADGLEILRDVGNRSAVANRLDHIASVRYALDDLAGTAIALAEQLEIAIDGSAALLEVRARAELALVSALRGDCQAAEEHLRRGREIIANGEDWGRKGGRLCLAGAITSVLVGDIDRARREIEAALAVFRSRRLPWDAADAHVQYARQLEAAGLTAEACPHRDAAVEIYRGLGAPARWTERALAPAVRS